MVIAIIPGIIYQKSGIFHFHHPMDPFPIEKPYYCRVLHVAIITAQQVRSLHGNQVCGSNPCPSQAFFFPFL